MSWIPHVMVLDDEPRVLESLIPSLIDDLARGFAKSRPINEALRRGEPLASGINIAVSAHGYTSERLESYRNRKPHHVHLHLVRERGGRFDLARRLLNEQLFAVVVSDLRFSDDAGGQRAGQLLVDEVARVHPEVEGLLYSAYPRPEEFPPERFVRKVNESGKGTVLADAIVQAVERHLAVPEVAAFAQAVADQGMVYQSDAFGSTLAQIFDLARLFAPEPAPKPGTKARRPLPCLLLDGESGTGKRGLAELFHAASQRRKAPLVVASCAELTNETLLRGILFGHKRGAFTDAREERAGLVASAGKGIILLDDFHRLPSGCSAILHSFLEDGEYSRLGEEEIRRHCEAAVVLTVESGPWAERRKSGELPLSFLARVERLPLQVPPLRTRPDDIEIQARTIARSVSSEFGVEMELGDSAVELLCAQSFIESNSRELRNVVERAILRYKREIDLLEAEHLRPFLTSKPAAAPPPPAVSAPSGTPQNEWQKRVRALASKIIVRGTGADAAAASALADLLFETVLPALWSATEAGRFSTELNRTIPWPVWEDVWRCFAVARLGGPTPAEKVLGIPANTLRQWISDREAK